MNIISRHAPAVIRRDFLDGIETSEIDLELAGRLWNCTDTLPGSFCDDLELPRGSTYAQAARHLIQLAKRKSLR